MVIKVKLSCGCVYDKDYYGFGIRLCERHKKQYSNNKMGIKAMIKMILKENGIKSIKYERPYVKGV